MKKILFTSILLYSGLFGFEDAQTILQNNGCMSCHAIASKKQAPAFAGIAKRTLMFNGNNAKYVLIESIKNGSKGKYPKFSDTAMPTFSNLSYEELESLASYILEQAPKAKGHGKGSGGCGKGGGMGHGMGMMR